MELDQRPAEAKPLESSGLRGAFSRFAEGGVYSWTRLIVLLLFGAAGGVLMGNAAPNIMDLLFHAFPIKGYEPAAEHSLSSTIGLAVAGVFIGMFVGAFALNSIAKVGGRWEKMPGGEKLNIFIGVFGGFIA